MYNVFQARMAELVDARDLKSLVQKTCGFDSRSAHQFKTEPFGSVLNWERRSREKRTRRGSIIPGNLLRRRITL